MRLGLVQQGRRVIMEIKRYFILPRNFDIKHLHRKNND